MSADRLRVLLIEDDDGDAELVSEMIAQARAMGPNGTHVEMSRAARLRDGLIMLGNCDIVLLDLTLPDSRGIDTLKAVRQAAPGVPVVVLSGNSDERVALEAVRNGAQDYLEKGHLGLKTLYRMLRFALERSKGASVPRRRPAPMVDETVILEERLKAAERALERVQRLANIGSWDWDIRANHVFWSTELYRLAGVGKSDFDGTYEAVLSRAHPDDRDRLHATIARAYESQEPFDVPMRFVRPDGEVRHVRFRGETVSGEQGEVARMMGTVEDVTEWVEVQAAVKAHYALIAALAAAQLVSHTEPTAA